MWILPVFGPSANHRCVSRSLSPGDIEGRNDRHDLAFELAVAASRKRPPIPVFAEVDPQKWQVQFVRSGSIIHLVPVLATSASPISAGMVRTAALAISTTLYRET
jgi:hypothetical protein